MMTWLINVPGITSWNRRIRITYWIIEFMIILLDFITWPLLLRDHPEEFDQLIRNQAIQSGLILFILMAAEWVYRIKSKLQDYVIIIIGSWLAILTLSLNSSDVHGVQVAMILPILISILYFDYKKVIFACVSALVPYFILTTIKGYFPYEYSVDQISIGYALIVLTTLSGLGIVNRGLMIMHREKKAILNEERHKLQQQAINQTSSKDSLTGLNNHKTFQEKLWQVMQSDPTGPLHLAIIDIDNFKSINDTFGHLSGDNVLRNVGYLLKTFSHDAIFTSRYGGEEFAVIFSEMENNEVIEWLELLRVGMENLRIPELRDRPVTVSIGVHQWDRSEDKDTLFRLADQALYGAKRNGKNQIAG